MTEYFIETDGLTVNRIIRHVARYFGCTPAHITGPARRDRDVLVRRVALFMIRTLLKGDKDASYSALGRLMSRYHTCIMDYEKGANAMLLRTDDTALEFQRELSGFQDYLYARHGDVEKNSDELQVR